MEFQPSLKEFEHFEEYINLIVKNESAAADYGTIKIIPPEGYKMPLIEHPSRIIARFVKIFKF